MPDLTLSAAQLIGLGVLLVLIVVSGFSAALAWGDHLKRKDARRKREAERLAEAIELRRALAAARRSAEAAQDALADEYPPVTVLTPTAAPAPTDLLDDIFDAARDSLEYSMKASAHIAEEPLRELLGGIWGVEPAAVTFDTVHKHLWTLATDQTLYTIPHVQAVLRILAHAELLPAFPKDEAAELTRLTMTALMSRLLPRIDAGEHRRKQ